jgi:hypothetical protein
VQGAAKRDLRKELEDFISVPRGVSDVVVSADRRLLVGESRLGGLEFMLADPDSAQDGHSPQG